MSTLEGRIAQSAQSEMGETWAALRGSKNYGDSFLNLKIEVVEASLFGAPQTDTDLTLVDPTVVDYAGKLVALQVINAGIDYWSKQPVSMSATGRNETKSYANRGADLIRLRSMLLEATAKAWPEVVALLPNRRGRRVSNVPRVRQARGVSVPNPDDFERSFIDAAESTTGLQG